MNVYSGDVPRYVLRLTFKVLLPITNLEYYQGVYWSAMLRDWIRPYFADELYELGIFPIPCQSGFREYYPGELIGLELSFPEACLSGVVEMLEDELQGSLRSTFPDQRLHLLPGKSVKLVAYTTLPEANVLRPVDYESCTDEITELAGQSHLDIIFTSPLRIKPCDGQKGDFRYIDPLSLDAELFWTSFCREMDLDTSEIEFPEILHKGLLWLDVPYSKTLGGLIGGIRIGQPLEKELLKALLWGQYRGIGKNRGFGFGFYVIRGSRLDLARRNEPGRVTFLQRAASLDNLRTCLEEMNSGSPGPDNLCKEDLLACGKSYLINARKMLLKGSLKSGDTLSFYKRSSNGNYRVITISNIHERHLLLSLLRQIERPLDRLIGNECYSYRKGKDYHQAAGHVHKSYQHGFAKGLKSDISAFFDSIPRESLQLLLSGLFGSDPAADLISSYMLSPGTGIPQGNPLSPLLSNLYLVPFDREIKKQGWHLVRYADDFCILSPQPADLFLDSVAVDAILNKLSLQLSAAKTSVFSQESSIDFLGYHITRNEFSKIKVPREDVVEGHGLPAFQDDFARGKPLYLTYRESHVQCDGGAVVIHTQEKQRSLSWKEISRIIVVGKPRISAGVIQQALIQQKPVVFMTIMGRQLGGFAHNQKSFAPADVFNSPDCSWDDFKQEYIRNLVAAKIHNQRTLLQNNNISELRLKELESSLAQCSDPEVLRGKEGASSVFYWQHYRELVKPLDFPRRCYHPPEGPVNGMLSLGYSILYFRMAECLAAAQLNPYEGIFHSPRGLHYALASDMIEPFRFLVDRVVLSLIHNRQIGADDFITAEGSTFCRLSSEAMKNYIHRYELTMRNEVRLGEEVLNWALLIDRSAFQLMRCLRLGLPYKPFRMP